MNPLTLSSKPKGLLRWVRTAGRILIGLIALAGVVLITAVIYLWIDHNQVVTLPEPSGSYPVGRMRFDWVDASRPEIFSTDPAAKRKMVWIWYPAQSTAKKTPAQYLPRAWVQAVEQDRGIGAIFFSQNLSNVHAHALEAAPPATSANQFPIILMQPGLGPIASDYTTLAEDLASRGYIVVASTPSFSSNVVVFQDGRVVTRSDRGTVLDSATPQEAKAQLDKLIQIWAADNRFVINQLTHMAWAGENRWFAGSWDLNRIGLLGHSFGGASAAQTCFQDPRCKAGVDLDGTPYGDVVQNGLFQPFMFIWSQAADPSNPGEIETTRAVRSIIEKSTGKIYQFEITGARHFNFSDYAVDYQPVLKLIGGLGSIDGRRGLKITTTYIAAFFDQILKNKANPLLDGPSTAFPEVKVITR